MRFQVLTVKKMYTSKELERFITEPKEYVDVETALELARQLLQQKQLNAALLKELCDSVELLS